MKLYWSNRSPFVRKVMIVLHETDQLADVQMDRIVVALPIPTDPVLLADAPLGKIPTLVLETGQRLGDSRVICEYLDQRAGAGLFPAAADRRFAQLGWQVLGDGLMDMLLLWRTELTRDTGPWPALVTGWQRKAQATLAALDQQAQAMMDDDFGIGQIAVICALGHLDFRWPDCGWRAHFPTLARAAQSWDSRPSVAATRPDDPQAATAAQVTAGQLTFGPSA